MINKNSDIKWCLRHSVESWPRTLLTLSALGSSTRLLEHLNIYTLVIAASTNNIYIVCIFKHFVISFVVKGAVNLALNKSAEQIDDYSADYPASNAVNGITDSISDYTLTESSDGEKWWKVDLEDKYSIGRIELYNRPDPDECMYCYSTV